MRNCKAGFCVCVFFGIFLVFINVEENVLLGEIIEINTNRGQIRGFHTNMLAISNASLIRKCIHCVGSFLQCANVYSIHCE